MGVPDPSRILSIQSHVVSGYVGESLATVVTEKQERTQIFCRSLLTASR